MSGWMTTLWFSEECSEGDAVPKFKVQSPIPTHRVSIIADFQTLKQFWQNLVSEPSHVLLLVGGSSEQNAAVTFYGWKDVQAIILQSLPDGTYMRLGVVTWSCLGRPNIDKNQGVTSVKELFEARRVVPCCQCGCQMLTETSFDRVTILRLTRQDGIAISNHQTTRSLEEAQRTGERSTTSG